MLSNHPNSGSQKLNAKNRLKRVLLLETVEKRELMAADASVVWSPLDSQVLFGETVEMKLTFDNKGTTDGYAPFVDVIVPSTSSSVALNYVTGSAVWLTHSLKETVVTFDGNGKAAHPFAKATNGKPVELIADPGSKLVVMELPLGSFTADQPAIEIRMQMSVDPTIHLGQSVQIAAQGGFRFGNDALDNPTVDPSVRGLVSNLTVAPEKYKTSIEYLGPENENVFGPNFVRSYRVNVDVATGASLSDLKFENLFDKNQVYLSTRNIDWSGSEYTISTTPRNGQASSSLDFKVPSIVGKPGVDGTYLVDFVVIDIHPHATNIPSLVNSNNRSTFQVNSSGLFNDGTSLRKLDTQAAKHELQNRVVNVQQSVKLVNDVNASKLGPGDTLEYRLDFQVSDYVDLLNILLAANVPDGQSLSNSPVTVSLSG